MVQNNTGDPELTALASDALSFELSANGIETAVFELDARLEAAPEGGLKLHILCSTRSDHVLKASVEVKGHGAPAHRLIPSMMSKAARDLAADCR